MADIYPPYMSPTAIIIKSCLDIDKGMPGFWPVILMAFPLTKRLDQKQC